MAPSRLTSDEGGLSEYSRFAALKYGRLWKMKARAAQNVHDNVDFHNDEHPILEENEEGEEEPLWMIALGSLARLIGGVAIVTFFSDPMCERLSALTDKRNEQYIPIDTFYISFVVTPLCSNASELVSSILLAMQKEKDKLNMTYSQIYGACIMNNTLCLGVFCALIYFQDLEWYFSAEVTVILLFEVGVGILGIVFNRTYPLLLAIIVICLYPVSLALVYFMEHVLHWG